MNIEDSVNSKCGTKLYLQKRPHSGVRRIKFTERMMGMKCDRKNCDSDTGIIIISEENYNSEAMEAKECESSTCNLLLECALDCRKYDEKEYDEKIELCVRRLLQDISN